MPRVQQQIPRTSHRTLRAAVMSPPTPTERQRAYWMRQRMIEDARTVARERRRDDWLTLASAFTLLLCVLTLAALLMLTR